MYSSQNSRLRTFGAKTLVLVLTVLLTFEVMPVFGYDENNIGSHLAKASQNIIDSVESNISLSDGSLQKNIELSLPPGHLGAIPMLSLAYNSSNRVDGVLGHGFSLQTISIERSTVNGRDALYENNARFDSSLDGELVPVGNDQYRAKNEYGSFRTYTKDGNNWIVTQKDGTTYTFAPGGAHIDPADTDRIGKWNLTEQRDKNGNTITYEYLTGGGMAILEAITYANTVIQFAYEDRPDPVFAYTYNFKSDLTQRLKNISILQQDEVVKDYEFGYVSGQNGIRSLLETVTEDSERVLYTFSYSSHTNGWEGDSTHVLPAVFSSQNGTDLGGRLADVNGDGRQDVIQMRGNFQRADYINGNSKVYLNTPNGWELSTDFTLPTIGGGYGFAMIYQIASQNYVRYVGGGGQTVDVNGDGYDDIVWSRNNGSNPHTYEVDVAVQSTFINNGDGTWTEDLAYALPEDILITDGWADGGTRFVDLNGDGLVDIFRRDITLGDLIIDTPSYQEYDQYYNQRVYLNTGSGWEAASGWALPQDIVEHNYVLNASKFADVNHDGLTDFVMAFNSDNHDRDRTPPPSMNRVLFNTGSGWQEDPVQTFPTNFMTLYRIEGHNYINNFAHLHDINADGMGDISVSFRNGLGSVGYDLVWQNTGSSYELDDSLSTPALYAVEQYRGKYPAFGYVYPIDIDGDTVLDIVRSGPQNRIGWQDVLIRESFINTGEVSDVITGITNYLGAETTVTYQGLLEAVDGNEYANNVPTNRLVVVQETHDPGEGEALTTDYQYEGADYYYNSADNRRFAGFSKITRTSRNAKEISYFHQGNGLDSGNEETVDGESLIGRVYKVEVSDLQDDVYSVTRNNYTTTDLGSGSTFAKLASTVELSYDGDGDERASAVSYTYDDTHGSVLTQTEWGEVDANSDGTFTDIGDDSRTTTYEYVINNQEIGVAAEQTDVQTTVFYAHEAGTGSFGNNAVNWDDARSGASSLYGISQTTERIGVTVAKISNTRTAISRGYLTFDTGALAGRLVNSATVSIRQVYRTYGYDTITANLTNSTRSNPATLSAEDYAQFGDTRLSDGDQVVANTTAWRDFDLNEAGLAEISLGGYTQFAFRASDDIDNQLRSYSNTMFDSAFPAGTDSDPKLVVEHYTLTYPVSVQMVNLVMPTSVTLSDDTGVLSQQRYYYDNLPFGQIETGDLTSEEQLAQVGEFVASSMTYDEYGNVLTVTDPRGNTTTNVYDQYNLYPATVTNALNQQTSYTYDYTSGNPVTTTDPNGAVYTTTFDGYDRPTAEYAPDPQTGETVQVASYTHNDTPGAVKVSKTTYMSDTLTNTSHSYYDGFGRVVQERTEAEADNQYVVRDFIYDADGQLAAESLPYFEAGSAKTAATNDSDLLSQYEYDPLGRVTSVSTAVGTTRTTFDQWQETVTDTAGNEKTFAYDAFGRLVTVVENEGVDQFTTNYTWSGNDNLTRIEDAEGNVRNISYDNLSRRTQLEDLHDPADVTFGTWDFVYDAAGNITEVTDPNSQTVMHTYDALNRQLTEDFVGEAGVEITYTYDTCTNGIGYLCTATNDSVVTSYNYTINGLLASESKEIDSTVYTSSYEYDRLGNQKLIIYPDGSEVSYAYNKAGQIERVGQRENGETLALVIEDVDYGPHAQIEYIKHANGVETNRTYDAAELYRLSNILTTADENFVLADTTPTVSALFFSNLNTSSSTEVTVEEVVPAEEEVVVEETIEPEQSASTTEPVLEEIVSTSTEAMQEDAAEENASSTEIVTEEISETSTSTPILAEVASSTESNEDVISIDVVVDTISPETQSAPAEPTVETIRIYSSSVDGRINTGPYPGTWENQRDDTTGRAADSVGAEASVASGAYDSSTGYLGIVRGFTGFDTTVIPDDVTVIDASLNLYVVSTQDDYNDEYSYVSVLEGSQISMVSLPDADIDSCGLLDNPVKGSADIDVTGVSSNAYLSIDLNQDGLGWIDPDGDTKLCLRTGHDIENSEPVNNNRTTWDHTRINFATSETAGTSTDPYLEITFTDGEVVIPDPDPTPDPDPIPDPEPPAASTTIDIDSLPTEGTYEVVIQPGPEDGKDTWYHGLRGLQNYSTENKVVAGRVTNANIFTYIEFDLSSLDSLDVADITNATIALYRSVEGESQNLRIDRLIEDWEEEDVPQVMVPNSYNYTPANAYVPAATGWWSANLTTTVRQWLTGTANYGVVIRSSGGPTNPVNSYSSNDEANPDLRPKLTVAFMHEGVTEPTELKTNGILDLAQDPFAQLSFAATYNSNETAKKATHYQVQVASDDGFTDVVWDSDVQDITSDVYDGDELSDISYDGQQLEADQTYYWRIRLVDELNFQSGWSAGQSFAATTNENPDPAPAPEPIENVIGEVGSISVDHNVSSVTFSNAYTDPVVIADIATFAGSDPSEVRIDNLTSIGFDLWVDEVEDLAPGEHAVETVNYFVIERGVHELPNGVIIEADTLDTSKLTKKGGFETVSYNAAFAATPVVLSQVQTYNDPTFVRTRQRNANASTFQVTLEQEELISNVARGAETIGWVAFSQTNETLPRGEGSFLFEAGITADDVKHTFKTKSFAHTYPTAPIVFGNVGKYDGSDASGLRMRNITATDLQFKVEEDKSKDTEIKHTTEMINYAAFASAGFISTTEAPPEVPEAPLKPIFIETIQNTSYSYDAVGNILEITDESGTDAYGSVFYTYDDLYRLTSANTAGASTTPYSRTYAYSPIGNIIDKSDVGTYTYSGATGNPHAAAVIAGVAQTYDENGNLTSTGNGDSFTWNYRNELVSSTVGGDTVTYEYDHNGQRTKKVGDTTMLYPFGNYEVKDGEVTKHIYLETVLVASVENTEPGIEVYHNHLDHLGSTAAVTNQTGVLHQLLAYYPFGDSRIDTQYGSTNQTNRYTGHDFDIETSLNYMNARYQSGSEGRFMSIDPLFISLGQTSLITNPQKMNSYAYTENNPLIKFDPDGRSSMSSLFWSEMQRVDNMSGGHISHQVGVYQEQAPKVALAVAAAPVVAGLTVIALKTMPITTTAVIVGVGPSLAEDSMDGSIDDSAKDYGIRAVNSVGAAHLAKFTGPAGFVPIAIGESVLTQSLTGDGEVNSVETIVDVGSAGFFKIGQTLLAPEAAHSLMDVAAEVVLETTVSTTFNEDDEQSND